MGKHLPAEVAERHDLSEYAGATPEDVYPEEVAAMQAEVAKQYAVAEREADREAEKGAEEL